MRPDERTVPEIVADGERHRLAVRLLKDFARLYGRNARTGGRKSLKALRELGWRIEPPTDPATRPSQDFVSCSGCGRVTLRSLMRRA